MTQIVLGLEQQLLPTLRIAGDEIAGEYPHVKVQVFSRGLAPEGHIWAISCLLIDAGPEQPDEVVLEITITNLSSSPRLGALVIWGYPGNIEKEIFAKPIPLNDDASTLLRDELPQLMEALKNAVKRGHPDMPISKRR